MQIEKSSYITKHSETEISSTSLKKDRKSEGEHPLQNATLSRRRLIELTGTAIASAAASRIFPDKTEAANNANSSAELPTAIENLQSDRGVIVDTLKEVAEQTDFDYGTPPSEIPDVPWQIPQLELLDRSLGALPEHFYRPGPDGTLHITLMPASVSPCDVYECAGLEVDNGQFPQVMFIDKYFDPSNEESAEDAFLFLTHELTHRKLKPFKLQENPFINEALGEEFAVARSKPGGMTDRLREAKTPLYDKVEELQTKHKGDLEAALAELSAEEREYYDFYINQEINLGVGFYAMGKSEESWNFPDEFAAAMAEAYVHGKDYFITHYSELFANDDEGREIVQRLYNYMKSVFEEDDHPLEYASLPVVTPPAV